jgi:hypothetical protein
MTGLYTHTDRAANSTLTGAVYNADHQNHVTNKVPEMMDDFSEDVAQMQLQSNPRNAPATTLAEEIRQLRFTLAEARSSAYWYTPRNVSYATYGTLKTSTSGSAVNFTGIPSWARRITVVLHRVSLTGTDALLVQIGGSGGIETTGYLSNALLRQSGSAARSGSTSGFIIRSSSGSQQASVRMVLTKISNTDNSWVACHGGAVSFTAFHVGGGRKTIASTLDRLSVVPSGSDTFDLGSINLVYE